MIVKARKRFVSDLSKLKSVELLQEVEYLLNVMQKCSLPDESSGFK